MPPRKRPAPRSVPRKASPRAGSRSGARRVSRSVRSGRPWRRVVFWAMLFVLFAGLIAFLQPTGGQASRGRSTGVSPSRPAAAPRPAVTEAEARQREQDDQRLRDLLEREGSRGKTADPPPLL